MTSAMIIDFAVQIKRSGQIHISLEKLSYEQLRETILNILLRIGGANQIRDFRDAVFKNINKNIQRLRPGKKKKNDIDINNIKEGNE
jgi:hypothetical protein